MSNITNKMFKEHFDGSFFCALCHDDHEKIETVKHFFGRFQDGEKVHRFCIDQFKKWRDCNKELGNSKIECPICKLELIDTAKELLKNDFKLNSDFPLILGTMTMLSICVSALSDSDKSNAALYTASVILTVTLFVRKLMEDFGVD